MSNYTQFQDFKKEVEKLREIDGAEEYAKQLAYLFLGNGLSLQTILLMAIEFGQQHPAWVSVEERLPEENTAPLVRMDLTEELKNKLTERFEFLAKRSEEQVSADIYDALLKAYLAGGEYGYQYAQEHPAWVSVEEELPPLHYEGANSTDFVLIYDGDDVLIAYYDFKEKKWYNEQYGALIIPATHWMPLPTPPVKKGGK